MQPYGHRGDSMRRREFIALIGGGAVAPLAARAQQRAMPVIGFLRSTTAADSTKFVTSFRQGLKETGFVEGENVAIEYRYADNQLDRLLSRCTDECTNRRYRHFGHVYHRLPPLTPRFRRFCAPMTDPDYSRCNRYALLRLTLEVP
jgi:hypothetical protein